MYELKNGSARLVAALAAHRDDPVAVQYLAKALNYQTDQLRQDIDALVDRMDQLRDLERQNSDR